MAARQERVGGWAKKVEIRKHRVVVAEQPWDVKSNTGNRVAKGHTHTTHGHGQRCGDGLREWGG